MLSTDNFQSDFNVVLMGDCYVAGQQRILRKSQDLGRGLVERMAKVRNTPGDGKLVVLCGCQLNRKELWVFLCLLCLLCVSLLGTILMWATNTFDNMLFSNLAIINNSQSFEMWRKPSPKPLLKMYIFNYTNVEEFMNEDEKRLHVQELGPYIYQEHLERVNIRFLNKSLVSYQEVRQYRYMPEISVGRKQNDRVLVPNVPFFAAAAMNRYSSFFTKLAVSSLLNGISATPFIKLPAHKFIVGYEDNLYSLSKSVLKLQNQKPYESFGLIASKIGFQNDVITINTGAGDINRIARIESVNGKQEMNHWSTAECNRFSESTDGTMFSPKNVREKRPVSFFFKDICRTMPLHFEREVRILNGAIPAFRYSLPYAVFDEPERTPANQCYCNLDLGACPAQGIFNATPCAFGAPAFISFPHFYNADTTLRNSVAGLDPNPLLHKTYADVHPTLGFVMAGRTRFQVNVQVIKSYGISQLDSFSEDTMLPVAWFEVSLEDKLLPDDMVSIIFQTTVTVRAVEVCLKFGCLFTAITTLIMVAVIVKQKYAYRRPSNSSSVFMSKHVAAAAAAAAV